MQDYLIKYKEWCEDEFFDENTREELKAIAKDEKEIKERFYRNLAFGTGGLRGIIGAGTNRMNLYTVGKATQGLANYIIKQGMSHKGVAIAFDSRNMSVEFSEAAALCLNANGIPTYRFETLRPTPELSFAVRELGCIAGIVVTASHNPPEYNGYKVYWEDGAQVTAPKDVEIINEVNNVTDFRQIKTMNREEAVKAGLFHVIGEDIDSRYIEELKKLVLSSEQISKAADKLKIVYTPLHGSGNLPVRRVLRELGFNNVYVVKEQEQPDGNFSTVDYPNPEDPKVYKLALKLAKEIDADLILATDPDADRLGIYTKDINTGEYVAYTGNMSGLLLCEYQLERRKELGLLPDNGAIVKTIVTTNMVDLVAKEYNVKLIETLTGFKFIGEQIKLFKQNNSYEYLFGFEESYGCLIGTHARDKDAIVAVMALCEAAAYYQTKGITLWEQMNRLYEKYGYFLEGLETLTLKGIEGVEKMQQIMSELRSSKPSAIGKYQVLSISDYDNDTRYFVADAHTTKTGLPKSDVVYYELSDNAWCCVRPSGTEPKIKFYFGVKEDSSEKAVEALAELKKAMMAKVSQ